MIHHHSYRIQIRLNRTDSIETFRCQIERIQFFPIGLYGFLIQETCVVIIYQFGIFRFFGQIKHHILCGYFIMDDRYLTRMQELQSFQYRNSYLFRFINTIVLFTLYLLCQSFTADKFSYNIYILLSLMNQCPTIDIFGGIRVFQHLAYFHFNNMPVTIELRMMQFRKCYQFQETEFTISIFNTIGFRIRTLLMRKNYYIIGYLLLLLK